MKLNSVTMFLVNKLLQMTDIEKAYEYLESKGFNVIGRGCESTVYSRKGYEYVIKIQRSYNEIKEVPCDKHFANLQYFKGNHEFNVMIQEKCEKFKVDLWPFETSERMETKIYKKYVKFVKFLHNKFDVCDTHDFNMGLKNGKLVSIDWNHM
jgi:RIO-like serine/threonine protein kinase